MSDKLFLCSVTRIADLDRVPFETRPIAREHWENADYVVVHIDRHPRGFGLIELDSGRMAEAGIGSSIVGALGVRHATLEAVGSYRDVGSDGRIEFLTSAGVLGRSTSLSSVLPQLLEGRYMGHVMREGAKLTMDDFVPPLAHIPFTCPTILIVGTSMSAGKTTAGKVIIRHLVEAGLRVVGAKLSGAGRYRDILNMSDAGAHQVFDFMDVGLPSSILPPEEFAPRLRGLLSLIGAAEPDVVVAEAGASPLEPYSGKEVIEEVGAHVRCLVLCASDPYAVVGVSQAFGMKPDLVAGLATSTTAGVELVKKLADVPALNVLAPEDQLPLAGVLQDALGPLGGWAGGATG